MTPEAVKTAKNMEHVITLPIDPGDIIVDMEMDGDDLVVTTDSGFVFRVDPQRCAIKAN